MASYNRFDIAGLGEWVPHAETQVERWLQMIRYKPGWYFTVKTIDSVTRGEPSTVQLDIQVSIRDAYHPEKETMLNSFHLPERGDLMDFERFYSWVFQCIREVEAHEAAEWFVLVSQDYVRDGFHREEVRPFDPHRPPDWHKMPPPDGLLQNYPFPKRDLLPLPKRS